MQCCLADPKKEPNGSDPAKGRYKQSKLMDLRFNRNAEAAPRRPDRATLIVTGRPWKLTIAQMRAMRTRKRLIILEG
ncbi:hypothetical protein HOY80DRAFT_952789 [Tuber brumale]|nr:hypothetical protein HOY80DRAFT_952789 [Tuber brumale]